MTMGIHHLGLTVNSLSEAKSFFVETLGWKLVKEDASYPSAFVSDGKIMVTLWKVQTTPEVAFDRKSNIGLHHFAICVESMGELEEIHLKVKNSSYEVEFAPQALGPSGTKHFIILGPSGIRIEFISPQN
ncbi:hypothetical protein A9Q84_15290 [Halobacteriovorax marinus]|uniref:VOC domain-containing protein n=1 Tax=Halobacteriovorax marinus TaxID=97084 RepID=A0A1Y5F5D2_9BACT|nr:hypothetical protein A9Q84_15290 [Halobacteriovorax marinus]